MIHLRTLLVGTIAIASMALCASASVGVPVVVTVTGTVEYNQISAPPLGSAAANDPVRLTFCLDSGVFVNSPSFPTRGYVIDPNTFKMTLGTVTIGLQSPFPANLTPYFVIRDNDPAVDGFFISTDIDFPVGVPLAQTGVFGQFLNNFSVTYGGSALPSKDILDAVGTWNYSGLQVYNWTVDDGPFNPLSVRFAQLTITAAAPSAVIYCQGKVNSLGCTPSLSTDAGLPSVSGGPWNITASDLINNKFGLFFYGFGRVSVPFQGGTLCVRLPVTRTLVQNSGGNPPPSDCSGQMVLNLAATIPPQLTPVIVDVQGWARDPADSFGSSLTDAVEVLVYP